jgi:DNA-binding SARP family transcriptional activator
MIVGTPSLDTIGAMKSGAGLRFGVLGALDILRFFDLLDRAAQAARDGAAAREADLLRQALSLWRGPVLANVPSETIHRDHVPPLVEKHIGALERWFDLCLLLGLHGEIITELTAATNAHPLRERLWAQLMLTLYRSGRQAEALESYRTIAGLLREELGLDPGEELRRLHERMLSGDPGCRIRSQAARSIRVRSPGAIRLRGRPSMPPQVLAAAAVLQRPLVIRSPDGAARQGVRLTATRTRCWRAIRRMSPCRGRRSGPDA